MVELYFLLIFMIIGAVVAVAAVDLLSSVIALGAVGLGLAMTFLVLKAPDVAITQLVVELLSLIILIRATLKRDLPFSTSGRWYLNTTIAIVFVLCFIAVAFKCLQDLPSFGYPLMRAAEFYLKEGLQQAGADNLVASVTLDYRAFDMLGEATILFTAVIGVMSIIRRVGKKEPGQVIEGKNE